MNNSPAYIDTGAQTTLCYCHAADLTEPEYMAPEVDSPLHCEVCYMPLECSLTPDGVNYVIEQTLCGTIPTLWRDGWYEGYPFHEPTRDWIKEISQYGGLSDQHEYIIELFLELTS